MSWERYRNQYTDFLFAILQANLMRLAAGSALKDFPRNLPQDLRAGLSEMAEQVSSILQAMGTGKLTEVKWDFSHPACWPIAFRALIRVIQNRDPNIIDLQSALFGQQIVTIIAYTEAFIGDSIRAICIAQPQIITSSPKQVTWATALSFPDRSSLLDSLVEEFVSDTLREKDIRNVLETIDKRLGFQVTAGPQSLKTLSLAEQVRHLILHSGGRVDAKFLQHNASPVPLGEPFPVDEDFVEGAEKASLNVAQSVFEAVSKKFFHVSEPLDAIGIRVEPIEKRCRT